MRKKFLSMLLTFVLILGLVPAVSVSAAECTHHTTHTEGVCYTVQEDTQITTPAELSLEEAAQLDLMRYNEAVAAYSALNQLMPLAENVPDNLIATVTRGDVITEYKATSTNTSINDAVADANKGDCTLTLYNIPNSDSNPEEIVLTGDNITLDLAEKTHTVRHLSYDNSEGTLTIQNGTLIGKGGGGTGVIELYNGTVIIADDAIIQGNNSSTGVRMHPYGCTLENHGEISGGSGAPGVDIQSGEQTGTLYNYSTIQGGSGANGVNGFVERNEGAISPVSVTNMGITVLENSQSVMDETGKAMLYYNGAERSFTYKFNLGGKEESLDPNTYTVDITNEEGQSAEPKDVGTYEIRFTDITSNSSKIVQLVINQSDTDFAGDIKTYNDNTETNTFTYGDTITVKVTPKATGTAPASTLSLRAAPAANQMALFCGDTQLTEPLEVTPGTELTFAYDTTQRLVPTGTVNLTAKYVGDDSMADHSEDVTVTINRKPLTVSDIDAVDRGYEAKNTTVEFRYVYFSGTVGSDEAPTFTATGSIPTENAGTHDVTVTITLDEESAKWYTVGTIPTVDVEIDKIYIDNAMKSAAGTLMRNGESTVTLPTLPLGASYGQPNSNDSMVTVVSLENGTLTVRGGEGVAENGSYTVMIPVAGGINYWDYTVDVRLTGTVKQAQTITAENMTAAYGDSGLKVTASANGGGTLSYEVTAGSDVISIDASGNITIKKAGTATVTVTAAETTDYAETAKDITVTVNKKALAIAPKAVSVVQGGTASALELVYNGLVSGDTVIPDMAAELKLYKSDGTEITVEEAVKTIGTYTIKWENMSGVTFSGADNYEITKTETASFTVTAKQSSSDGSSSGSGGGGGGASRPAEPETIVDTDVNDETGGGGGGASRPAEPETTVDTDANDETGGTTTTVVPEATVSGDTASSEIMEEAGQEIIDSAVESGSTNVELVSGKIIIEKTDEVTGKGIAGVEFEIRDKDGKVIETLVTDKNGHAESKELPIAVFKDGNFVEDIKYFVVETKAAEGYILDSTPHEVVLQYDDDAPKVVTYTLSLTNKPTEPKLPQTGDNMNPWLFAGVGLAAIVAGVFVFKKKKKDIK